VTPEGKVKEFVKAQLKSVGAYKHMPVQNGMGEPALDFHVCHKGIYAAIETKAEGKIPTVRQRRTMRKVRDAGGCVFMIDHGSGVDFAQLVGWLVVPTPGFISQSAKMYMDLKDDDDKRND